MARKTLLIIALFVLAFVALIPAIPASAERGDLCEKQIQPEDVILSETEAVIVFTDNPSEFELYTDPVRAVCIELEGRAFVFRVVEVEIFIWTLDLNLPSPANNR